MNPKRLKPHIKAEEIRQTRRLDEMNFQSWMNGVYFTHALACAFAEGNSYPEAPFDLHPEEAPVEERRRREAELFAVYAAEYNKQLIKEE